MIFLYGMLAIASVIPIALYRFLKGPSIPDRALALDLITAIVIGMFVLNALNLNAEAYIDAALVLAMFGFLSTVAIAKYVEQGDLFG